MAAVSELARLYEAVFGTPPSVASTAALLRMEAMLGLTKDDPLARMLIVLLRAADQDDESRRRRTEEEEAFINDLRELSRDLQRLLTSIGDARFSIGRWKERWRTGKTTIKVDCYGWASPLLNHLLYAFRRRIGVVETDERVISARFDLLYGIGAIVFSLMIGVAIGRVI